MSEQIQPQNNSDEIDLGQLFKIIGKGFKNFFNFIGNIFKGIFHLLVLFLIFIQKHIIKFALAGVLGLAIGWYLDSQKEPMYESSMVVEPNFNSVQQLYNNINFYNELAKAQDSIALAQALKVSVKEAASIKEIAAESYSDENQKVRLFDDFIRTLDTTTLKTIDDDKYLKNFNSFDARFHTITVFTTNNMLAKKIQPEIIKSIARNPYFENQKKINDENLLLQEEIYNKQLAEIDSLQVLYKNVMLKTADNPVTGTSINLADEKDTQVKEIELINQRDVLKNKIVSLNNERANKANIINVISDFPNRGVEVKGIFKSYKFLVAAGFIGLVFLTLALLQLNMFLKKYNKTA